MYMYYTRCVCLYGGCPLFRGTPLPAGTPDAVLNPKKKIFDNIRPDLFVNEEGVACYKGTPFKVEGRDGDFTAPTLRQAPVK